MIAALNTSFEAPALGVGRDGELLAAVYAPGWPADLADLVTRAISEAGLAPDVELAGVVVATGPGRFGSLRGGIAFAKGLALARRIPLLGVPTAAAVAEAAGADDASVVSPAGRGRWYVTAPSEADRIQLVDAGEVVQAVYPGMPVAGPVDANLAAALADGGRQVWPVDGQAALEALVRLADRRLREGCGPASLGAQPVYAAPATRARPWVRGIPHG
ncbi:MAG: tRNA (adenosine(37)-N6)-threonylcarbamoyltransferase complex dimerization subunit type 1 TsaB [Chloroflexota bacterium]|nr:tRNA (adenosine(37)-N6)-threonylcarbamoyltransferase complex dimerization subunit type 1 TsaB [Chloroflexota bacterium]